MEGNVPDYALRPTGGILTEPLQGKSGEPLLIRVAGFSLSTGDSVLTNDRQHSCR